MKKIFESVSLSFPPKGIRLAFLGVSGITMLMMSIVLTLVFLQIKSMGSKLQGVLGDTVPALTSSLDMRDRLHRLESIVMKSNWIKGQADLEAENIDNLINELDQIRSIKELYEGLNMPELAVVLRKKLLTELDVVFPTGDKIVEHLKAHRNAEAHKSYEEELLPAVNSALDTLGNIELNNSEILEKYRSNATHSTELVMGIGGLVVALLSLSLVLIVTGRIMRNFSSATALLGEASDRSAAQSQTISLSAEEVSRSATEAASALTETSASIEQIRSMMEMNDSNAKQSSLSSKESIDAVHNSQAAIDRLAESLVEINSSTEDLAASVQNNGANLATIIETIQMIAEKTTVINEIVFQTKLLSFNASVEAARAGEHGRGFSIVAGEVGKLAQSSGDAARAISDLLSDSRAKVGQIITSSSQDMDHVASKIREKVKVSTSLVQLNRQILDELVQKSQEVDNLVQSISSAVTEETKGVKEITVVLQRLSELADKNATSSREILDSAKEGQSSIDEMETAIFSLNKIIKGAA